MAQMYTMAYRDDSIDEHASFLTKEGGTADRHHRGASSRTFKLLTICNGVFFLATLLLYSSSWIEQSKNQRLNPRLRQVHSYCKWHRSCVDLKDRSLTRAAPLLDAVDLPLEVKTLNGTLYPNHHPSVARGPPSPEKDAVWDEWEITRIIAITADQVRALGKDATTATKLEARFPAPCEILH